jgi:protein-tyrosine phosphatase
VHCHAGYGRTGLVIASALVYSQNLSGDEAVAIVRRYVIDSTVNISMHIENISECALPYCIDQAYHADT